MNNFQKQCLLKYLGYYSKEVDGIWGANSKKAESSFKADYGVDANGENLLAAINETISPVKKDDGWNSIQYFKRTEFKCKCGRYCNGYPAEIDLDMVRIADSIRSRLDRPVTVNSGLRCRQHNANVGGASASQHMYGKAADLGCPTGITPQEMYNIAEEIMGDTGGLGLYGWGIHIDSRSTKARWKG
jgi:hypothetical protein